MTLKIQIYLKCFANPLKIRLNLIHLEYNLFTERFKINFSLRINLKPQIMFAFYI